MPAKSFTGTVDVQRAQSTGSRSFFRRFSSSANQHNQNITSDANLVTSPLQEGGLAEEQELEIEEELKSPLGEEVPARIFNLEVTIPPTNEHRTLILCFDGTGAIQLLERLCGYDTNTRPRRPIRRRRTC
jgi:hypothetical protein